MESCGRPTVATTAAVPPATAIVAAPPISTVVVERLERKPPAALTTLEAPAPMYTGNVADFNNFPFSSDEAMVGRSG